MDRILNILIIDDSEDDALLLLRELRRGGFEPDQCWWISLSRCGKCLP
jgi:hypothetical protein